jgi:hypothetical protein
MRRPSLGEISCDQKGKEMFHGPRFNVDTAQRLDLRRWSIMMAGLVVGVLLAFLLLVGPSRAAVSISFGKSTLHNQTSTRPTSLQFGPDGRLYVAQQNGLIKIYTIRRISTNNYNVTATQTVRSIKNIPNHDDDGVLDTNVTDRQVTGILVRGTKTNPVIYATSSDPRIGGVSKWGNNGDVNLDTNSGVLSRLRWTGSSWEKVDLVRGLPRSEENHSSNGLQLDPSTNTIYIAQGGNTNMGAPSDSFALLPEYALSAAILKVDLDAIGTPPYDLPTLDDDDRAGNPDANDPFGGNDGKNQAKLVPGGPVQVYEPGFRNPYDLLIAKSGKMYTIDNSSNAGAGDVPVNKGPAGECTNQPNEGGTTQDEALDLVGPSRYGGHANPTRGNMSNTFNSDKQSPVTTDNPIECHSLTPGVDNGSLTTFGSSTNGLTEYTASNFGGAMKGDLLAAGLDDRIYRIKLNGTGNGVVLKQALFSNVGNKTLDVTAQGDARRFQGTIWVANIGSGTTGTGSIKVFEPNG